MGDIDNYDYRWIKDETKIDAPTADTPVINISAKVEKLQEEYAWKDVIDFTPNIYQLVLIKLDNDIITTGRFNEHGKWQIEIDRGRSRFDKYPDFKVVKWKEIDVEDRKI